MEEEEQQKMKGELYSEISEIISQKDAWSRIIGSVEFDTELYQIIEDAEDENEDCLSDSTESEIAKKLEATWRKNGISAHFGYYLRKDGMVEVEYQHRR